MGGGICRRPPENGHYLARKTPSKRARHRKRPNPEKRKLATTSPGVRAGPSRRPPRGGPDLAARQYHTLTGLRKQLIVGLDEMRRGRNGLVKNGLGNNSPDKSPFPFTKMRHRSLFANRPPNLRHFGRRVGRRFLPGPPFSPRGRGTSLSFFPGRTHHAQQGQRPKFFFRRTEFVLVTRRTARETHTRKRR